MIRPTPWERLDGVKHTLEAILELTVQWEQQRIIKLLEAECDCTFFEKYQLPSKCYAHRYIALIKGEK